MAKNSRGLIGKLNRWYAGQPAWIQIANAIFFPLFVIWLVISVAGSQYEIKALIWHAKHGNHFVVGGASFPICLWQLPATGDGDGGLHIYDGHPSELRPENSCDAINTFDVYIHSQQRGTAQQRAEALLESWRGENRWREQNPYNLEQFAVSLKGEPMTCVFNGQGWVECFGDGSIREILARSAPHDAKERFLRLLNEVQ